MLNLLGRLHRPPWIVEISIEMKECAERSYPHDPERTGDPLFYRRICEPEL